MQNTTDSFNNSLLKKEQKKYNLRSIKKSTIMMFFFISLFITAIVLLSYRKPVINSFSGTNNNVSKIDNQVNKSIAAGYQEDIVKFKKETATKIAANSKKISEFKKSKEYEKANNENNFKNEIVEFEHRNTDLAKRIENYTENGQYQWQVFKAEFENDINELGRNLNSLKVSNTK